MKYDLEQRTTKFGEEIIRFCYSVNLDCVIRPLISQLVRSGTSVGANYREAIGGSSRKDFCNKIYICKKEIQESSYWIHLICYAKPEMVQSAASLINESLELTKIFQAIVKKINNSSIEN